MIKNCKRKRVVFERTIFDQLMLAVAGRAANNMLIMKANGKGTVRRR